MSILPKEYFDFKRSFYRNYGISVHAFACPRNVLKKIKNWKPPESMDQMRPESFILGLRDLVPIPYRSDVDNHYYRQGINIANLPYGELLCVEDTLKYLEENKMNAEEFLKQLRADHCATVKRANVVLQVNWNVYHLAEVPIMVTFSFTDDTLASTSAATRHRYVSRTLNQPDVVDYIASIDYGKKNHREHYHALVWVKGDRFRADKWAKDYGYIHSEKIEAGDFVKAAKYATKTALYATKMSGVSVLTKRDSPFHQARREQGTKELRHSLTVSQYEKAFGDDIVEVI